MENTDQEFQPGEIDSPDADEALEAREHLTKVLDYIERQHGRAWTRAVRTARQQRWRNRSYESRTNRSALPAATRKSA